MKKAFTIIELMICLAVVSILAGAAVPQVRLWNARNRGLEAMTSIISDYSKARTIANYIVVEPASGANEINYDESLAGLDSQVHIGKRPQVALKFAADGKSYSILQKNKHDEAWTSTSVVTLKKTTLPSGVAIKRILDNTITSNDLFFFSPDGRLMTGNANGQQGVPVITDSRFSFYQDTNQAFACGGNTTIRQKTELVLVVESKIDDGKYVSYRIDFNTLGAYHVCVAYHSVSGTPGFDSNGEPLQF